MSSTDYTDSLTQSVDGLSLSAPFGERDQFLRHPLADALRDCVVDADASIVPVVTTAFRSTVALVIFGLFEAEQNARDHFVPVLKLNAAPDDRQARGPVFLRRPRVLLRNRQRVERRKWRTGKVFDQLLPNLFVRPVRMLLSQRLRTTKNVRDCGLLNHCSTFSSGLKEIPYTDAGLRTNRPM